MRRRSLITLAGVAGLLASTFATNVGVSASSGARKSSGWSVRTYLPEARQGAATAVGYDGNIYVFGGTNGLTQDYNTTYVYHPKSSTWSIGTTMPIVTEGAAAVTLQDGRILVLGGGTGCHNTMACTIYDSVQAYNPKTHAWCLLAPMHIARFHLAVALGKDGLVYAIGGWNGTAALSSVEAYNPRTNTWKYAPSLPQAEQSAVAVVTHNRIAVLGGSNGSGVYYNDLFVFNGHGWDSGSPMPTARHDLAAAVDVKGRIVAAGGYNENGYLSTVEIYDPATDSWSGGQSLPHASAAASAVTAPGGQIYVIGGYNGLPMSSVLLYGPRHNPFTACSCSTA